MLYCISHTLCFADKSDYCLDLFSDEKNYMVFLMYQIEFMKTAYINNTSENTMKIECLRGSEAASMSHLHAFLVGIGCCRSTEQHLFYQEHKFASLVMFQTNQKVLPSPSSLYFLHHLARWMAAYTSLQMPTHHHHHITPFKINKH